MRGVLGPREFAMRAAKNYLSASTGLRQILDLASLHAALCAHPLQPVLPTPRTPALCYATFYKRIVRIA